VAPLVPIVDAHHAQPGRAYKACHFHLGRHAGHLESDDEKKRKARLQTGQDQVVGPVKPEVPPSAAQKLIPP